ncbi:MAG: alpha/beta hydrolase [Deltaproteobacteria bacterium]|nr:alpha/beta hydrolase [Deltaproteobacteria bacterium]
MPHIMSHDGKKTWYDVVGEGEPLVLIGGSSLVHRQWDFMIPILQDHFRVILYDQRGAGLSDRSPEGITVDQWTDDLKEILDRIGIEKAHIMGTSNGSFIVVHFAARYPERTASIIHYGMYKSTEQFSKVSRIGERIIDEFGVGNGSMGAYYLVRLYGIPPLYEEWETNRFEENLSPDGWKAMHAALDVDLTEDLQRIKAPQLILIGDRGSLSKDSDYGSGWKDVLRLCSDVELAVIHGAEGTYCVVTHPAEVAKEVIAFFRTHRIGS